MRDEKNTVIAEPLKSILAELKLRLQELYGERLSRVILYGSQARGDAEEDSDIDVLVVLSGPYNSTREQEKVSYITSELGIRHTVHIATLVVSEEEIDARRDFSFFQNISHDGIAL